LAIFEVANGSEKKATKIWEDPTPAQFKKVLRLAAERLTGDLEDYEHEEDEEAFLHWGQESISVKKLFNLRELISCEMI
jgi:hypothetical protein